MAEFIVHGIVNGQEISRCSDLACKFCEGFYVNGTGTKHYVNRLVGNRMAYSYIVYANPNSHFASYTGRAGSYFGMTIIFENKQVANPDALFKILQATYDNYVKGHIIKEYPSGAKKWIYPTLTDPNDTVAVYLGRGLEQILKQNPNLLKYQALPPLPQQTRSY